MAPIPRLQAYEGPALFSYGFRPFFLFGAIYAALAVLLWLPAYMGDLTLPTAFASRDWHVHEMLYGYVPAVVTGFLLTAIPNWTGRLPLQGRPLIVLTAAWFAGRLAVTFSGVIGDVVAMIVDASFLLLVAAAAAREVFAGSNWRNLKVVVLISLLAIGNACFHLEAHISGTAEYSARFGLAIVIMLITLIGGRIVPSFTRNWLARERPGRLPASFGPFDIAVVAASAAALLAWIVVPENKVAGLLLLVAGALQLLRLSRWAGDRTFGEPLVLILHVGYAFVPIGLVLIGMAAFGLVPIAAGIHALAGGAIGTMTLAVMTRASLGHTGHALHASYGTRAIYAAIVLAAVARVAAALVPEHGMVLLSLAGLFWTAAFAGFAIVYGPIVARSPRLQKK
jgi:uncharacterized protein involved in response to NO